MLDHTRILLAVGVLLACPGLATAQRTSVARDFPIYDNGGLPDLVMDPQRFTSQMEIVGGKSHGYDCGYQGITAGWGDWYYKQLVGQWIDSTGVPEGDHIVRVALNNGDGSGPIFNEGLNVYRNVTEVRIHVPNPRHKVEIIE